MSWFDATGLANIAKSALKGAQKTIDKALDIKDEDLSEDDEKSEKEKMQGAGDNDFFASWGLAEKMKTMAVPKSTASPVKDSETETSSAMHASNWGSFLGSFFEVDSTQTEGKEPVLISTQPQRFHLTLGNEESRLAPLASPENELTPSDGDSTIEKQSNESKLEKSTVSSSESSAQIENLNSDMSDVKLIEEDGPESNLSDQNGETQSLVISNRKPADEGSNLAVEEKVITRQKPRRNSNRNSYISNRLSVISTESEGKKSCDSVEVLGSVSCTTSPDTDLPSISTSSSMGIPVSSSGTDSVEVISTFRSPSSIEVIDSSSSGRSTRSSDVTSPAEDISVNQYSKELIMISSPKNSSTDVSPESVEVLPDLNELDDELSIADSYTSASESTGATILEPPLQYSCRTAGSYTDVSLSSSKFRSGESTPDVLGKMPMTNKSSSDVLCESINEMCNFEFLNSAQIKPGDLKKAIKDTGQTSTQHISDVLIDNHPCISKSVQGSPTKKPFPKPEDKPSLSKADDERIQKFDLPNIEIKKAQGKRDADEENYFMPNSDRSDSTSMDDVCGSSSSQSDSRTLIANDSSREGTLMETSAEDASGMTLSGNDVQDCGEGMDKTDRKIQQSRQASNSFYVKSLLAEAMGEDSATRETSPTLSEKSRSDLVKVGSEQTSEHTSGDELETTTSSDIEIISRYSPNGDSSSTASRHSPAKLLHNNSKGKLSLVAVDILGKATQSKTQGHQREPSEASSFCSEDNSAELEKLSKKVTELTEILADRESKLMDLTRVNMEMREKNQELKQKMEQAKVETEARTSSALSEAEKDEMIRQLREEGEKLSKKELKQATLIKTLRSQEKLQQKTLEKNKSELQSLTQELDKVKSKLTAKEELEKAQVESINQLTNKINRQDKEIANLLDEMEKAVVKAEELNISLDKAAQEIESYKEKLSRVEEELAQVKSAAETKAEKLDFLDGYHMELEMELEYLRQQLKKNEEVLAERENYTKEEKSNMMRRLQEAETRNEELTQSVSHATKRLLRQMEALQATVAHERETWEKQERVLLQKLDEAETNCVSAEYRSKANVQEVTELRTRMANLEIQLQASCEEGERRKEKVETLEKELEEVRSAWEKEKKTAEGEKEAMRLEIVELKGEIANLERQLANERSLGASEKEKVAALQEQLKERELQHGAGNRLDSNSPRSSPALSFGRASLSESLSLNWPQFPDDAAETFSTSGRCSNVYENLRSGNATSLIEGLQSQLKMREGEVSQLQLELERRESERAALTSEISSLTMNVEELEALVRDHEENDQKLNELQRNYNALLQMYGEKVEEAEELKFDLEDVKEMYKVQIDQLLKRENQDVAS